MKSNRSEFFDENPVLYPFPKLLIRYGFSKVFKLRDLKFKKYLESLGLQKGVKVLEVGSGDGVFLKRVVKTYQIKAWGIDNSFESVRRAKLNSMGIDFRVGDAINLPFKNKSFDFVLSFDTLEHINSQNKALEEMMRVLKPGGRLLLYTINKNQKYTWNYFMDKVGIDIYKKYDHDPDLFLDQSCVRDLIQKNGLKTNRVENFGAFFTLAIDELIMVMVLVITKLNSLSKNSKNSVYIGSIIINLLDYISRLLLPVMEFFDKPWISKKHSNGFFILGEKNGTT